MWKKTYNSMDRIKFYKFMRIGENTFSRMPELPNLFGRRLLPLWRLYSIYRNIASTRSIVYERRILHPGYINSIIQTVTDSRKLR